MKNENGIERSAILKGQTLVNLLNIHNGSYYGSSLVGETDFVTFFNMNDKKVYFDTAHENGNYKRSVIVEPHSIYTIQLSPQEKFRLINLTEAHGWTSENYAECKVVMLKGDYTNVDIPYFEGMQSVKNSQTLVNIIKKPTTENIGTNKVWKPQGGGKVTYSYDTNKGVTLANTVDGSMVLDYMNLSLFKPNTDYTLFIDVKWNGVGTAPSLITITTQEKKLDNGLNIIKFTTVSDLTVQYMSFRLGYAGIVTVGCEYTFNNIMVLEGDWTNFDIPYFEGEGMQSVKMPVLTTSNEDGTKTNILTINEPVELRGIGEVQDTLDCLTGEVTERIGEIVLDGSENWKKHSTFNYGYTFVHGLSKSNSLLKVNNYPIITSWGDGTTNGIFKGGESIAIVNTNVNSLTEFKQWLSQNPITVQFQLAQESIKTVDLTIQDQDNQPQERMKLFPTGYINTSSSTFLPILELKGITHNNKLNMTTTNGTNNTQLATLDNLALDGIICRDGTVVRDSYDVESGLYTKRVFRVTVDEEFIERYRGKWTFNPTTVCFEAYVTQNVTGLPKSIQGAKGVANNLIYHDGGNMNRVCVNINGLLYILLLKEELISYDVDGLLDWIRRNGAIEVAYQLAEPQIIHMQPNMQPYVSTRPYQGSIESQGNILESSFLDYTSEQSIISPKPLGDGDVLRWEQGSQCYIYENDKEYIPLTDYNQPMGTVLDLEEEDGEQFVENLDGGDIIVDVPFKEKAVYERHLVSHEDKVIYPTQDKLDPTGKIEVDYICGETWQNPNDLSDIRHVGTLREDGQYDVTIRRSGDDEIRLMDGATHLSLDYDKLPSSEFELTFFNSGGVEVGKYGDTTHVLEDCVENSKLASCTVYGQTLNNLHQKQKYTQYIDNAYKTNCTITAEVNNITVTVNKDFTNSSEIGSFVLYAGDVTQELKPSTKYLIVGDIENMTYVSIRTGDSKIIACNDTTIINSRYAIITTIDSWSETDETNKLRILFTLNAKPQNKTYSVKNVMMFEYQDDMENHLPTTYFEQGMGSTVVNGFSSCGKNFIDDNLFLPLDNTNGSVVMDRETGWIEADIRAKCTWFYLKDIDLTKLPKGQYELVFEYDNSSTVQYYSTQLDRVDGTYNYGYKHIDTTTGLYTKLHLYVQTNDTTPSMYVKFRVMLVPKNVTNRTYEPYKSVDYTLPTPITLNKVGDVCDTFDVVSGVETRNVERFTFDGDENWTATFNSSSSVFKLPLSSIVTNSPLLVVEGLVDGITSITIDNTTVTVKTTAEYASVSVNRFKNKLKENPITIYAQLKTPQTIQHTYIPSSIQTTQEPTFILPQPLRSVPNGICDRLYWDENKGHYCIEKRVEELKIPLYDDSKTTLFSYSTSWIYRYTIKTNAALFTNPVKLSNNIIIRNIDSDSDVLTYSDRIDIYVGLTSRDIEANLIEDLTNRQRIVYYALATSEIIDLPHLNKKLTLPTQPNTLPIGYKVESQVNNPQLGLTIPYKQLNYPSRPQNIDFKMDIADYVLTWDDVKEARQYNIILNDRTIATVKEPQWNSGEEMYGYIMVEAQNELAENLSEELYIKTVPNAPAQLTVAHNPMTDYYDFEISFIKTSAIAEYYTVQYRIDGGEWVYKTIQSDEIDPNSKVLWKFSVYEINEQIEVWATATNEIGTNDILPVATYYMSPTPQWTYRINSKELFVRWMDDSPYDTQYKLRYQYKSDGIYRYAYFEGDKQEIGKLYEALIPLADDEEVSIALCIISEKENLYTKPIKASKELDPNIKPPKNFNYHWLARGLIEFYWEDNYDVDVEYEAIVEHRLTSRNNEWITDTRIFSATDTEGTGTVYRLSYQLEDLEEIRVKVRMKWAMNETEWSESLTTVFIPVEGNPPQWIRRTQTQEGLLVEWEAQEYVDSYHVYVMSNGEELQHLETMDNFIYVDLDYSNPIDIEIYEATRFSGGIQSDPSDKMRFRPTMDKHQLIHDVVTPDTLTYEIEVDTVQRGIKERQQIHDINTTPKVTSKQPMDVSISSPFTLSFHPLQLDVHQAGSKYYGNTELHIKTLDVKSRDAIEVLTFERITDQYGVDFTVYTPSASKYPITLEVNRVRIVCFGDSLTSGHPGFWAETGTGDPQHCYEYWLDRRLKGQYEILNKGYGSDTTDRMLARFDRDVLSYSPQYCIIQGGTNDMYMSL